MPYKDAQFVEVLYSQRDARGLPLNKAGRIPAKGGMQRQGGIETCCTALIDPTPQA